MTRTVAMFGRHPHPQQYERGVKLLSGCQMRIKNNLNNNNLNLSNGFVVAGRHKDRISWATPHKGGGYSTYSTSAAIATTGQPPPQQQPLLHRRRDTLHNAHKNHTPLVFHTQKRWDTTTTTLPPSTATATATQTNGLLGQKRKLGSHGNRFGSRSNTSSIFRSSSSSSNRAFQNLLIPVSYPAATTRTSFRTATTFLSRTERSLEQRLARHSSVYDSNNLNNNNNWRNWYSPAEYENPWDVASPRFSSGPIGGDQPHPAPRAADAATKHVIAQLQTFHHFEQHVSTEFCNAMLKQLLDGMPTSSSTATSKNSTTIFERTEDQGRVAERAHAILQNMELFDKEPPRTATTTTTTVKKLPRPWPKPNRETYNLVVRIFSRTHGGDRSIPDAATAIVRRMQDRYETRHELDMKVIAFHWNCVLLAWMNCTDWEKAFHAVQLLMQNANAPDANTLIDASSYIHALRVCAYRNNSKGASSSSSSMDEKEAQLGANVAVKLWQELFERQPHNSHGSDDNDDNGHDNRHDEDDTNDDNRPNNENNNNDDKDTVGQPDQQPLPIPENLPSHFYSHFFQAIRPLPIGSPRRDEYYEACMKQACERGKVNQFVLQDFFVHVKSQEIFNRLLGPYRKQVFGMQTEDAVRRLMEISPPEWKANAD